jgi:hypothetical protein
MGIVTEVLVTAKIIHEFKVPVWVILAAHAHCVGHVLRRLAHRTHHGQTLDPPEATDRFLR